MLRLFSLTSSPVFSSLRLLSTSSSLYSQPPPPPLRLASRLPRQPPPPPPPQPTVGVVSGIGPPSPFDASKFGDSVLTDDILHSLIGPAFEKFQEFRGDPENFDLTVVDQCANAMKTWALSKGATHYTHWFQPLSGVTAAKHNSFLQKKPYENSPLLQFSGKDLVKGETDGSSFPSGGIRSLLEARGYTVWDMNSPPFVRRHDNCTCLVIPTAFVSWSGLALDVKTPLLRSEEAVNKEATRLLRLLGDHDPSLRVESFVSAEQEFFMIDKNLYDLRPDLRITGRTLFSAPPPRGQDLEDHYYGKMPSRILQCLHEAAQTLWELGVPTMTRYSEVAPGQFELCPIYESSSLACDHNILVMEILTEVAKRHNLIMLSHEKPFAYINGSGKHINWSLSTDGGKTSLFQSGEEDPAMNTRFWMFIIAFIRAVHTHSELVRAAVVCPGNDYRLGENEAPVDIISVYIGEVLDQVCKQIMGQSVGSSELKNAIKLGNLPPLARDSIDRNRTGPIAFAQNKFEFRTVGSSQTCATVVTLLNTIMADALDKTSIELEDMLKQGKGLDAAAHAVMKNTLREHYNIVFNGNSNSEIWSEEAQLRGLPRNRTAPAALSVYNNPSKTQVFMRMGVLTEVERESRRNVTNTSFLRHITVELRTMLMLVETEIIPAGMKLQDELARSINQAKDALGEEGKKALEPQMERLKRVSIIVSQLIELADSHKMLLQEGETVAENKYVDPHSVFAEFHPRYTSALKEARVLVDELETLSNNWPFPRYSDMLLVV